MNPPAEAPWVRYHHTQFGWPNALAALGVVGVVVLVAGIEGVQALPPVFLGIVGVVLVALSIFSRLDTMVTDEEFRLAFRPGWPRRVIPLTRIRGVHRVHTSWFWGWGIRLTHRGWLWNVSGLEGVEFLLEGGQRLRVGSDDVDGLLTALEAAGVRTLANPSGAST